MVNKNAANQIPILTFYSGLKPFSNICRSYGTLFPTNRYVTYHLSFTGLKTRC